MDSENREQQLLRPGAIVSHFKRDLEAFTDPMQYLYEIIGVALHTETREPLVVYRALYAEKGLFCRPKQMFLSPVDQEKYPNARQAYRFQLCETDVTSPGLEDNAPAPLKIR